MKTTITDRRTGVKISYGAVEFPKSWLGGECAARAQPACGQEADRAAFVVQQALAVYPPALVSRYLRNVHLMTDFWMFGIAHGGTGSGSALYLLAARGDDFMRRVTHHEFSHVLMQRESDRFDRWLWCTLNPKGFEYKTAHEAIRSNFTATFLDEAHCRDGFICEYARASLEEDIAMMVEYMVEGGVDFWRTVGRFPALRHKVNAVRNFYRRIYPQADVFPWALR